MGTPAAVLEQSSDAGAGGWEFVPDWAMVPRFGYCCQRGFWGESSQGPGLFIILRESLVIFFYVKCVYSLLQFQV